VTEGGTLGNVPQTVTKTLSTVGTHNQVRKSRTSDPGADLTKAPSRRRTGAREKNASLRKWKPGKVRHASHA